jgi:hypothetical protein
VDYEYSEMIMYEAQMLWESGKVDDCLRHVTEFQDTTGDELAVKEMLGICCGDLRGWIKFLMFFPFPLSRKYLLHQRKS